MVEEVDGVTFTDEHSVIFTIGKYKSPVKDIEIKCLKNRLYYFVERRSKSRHKRKRVFYVDNPPSQSEKN